MEYTKVNGLDREVSRIGLGTWAIGGFMWGGTDEREALGTIRTAAISVNADFGPLKNSINPSCKLDLATRRRVMETGIKLNISKTIRASKTGMPLPRAGTLVSVSENLGRTLLLVEFENGQHEYLFDYEVEFENRIGSSQKYGTDCDAWIRKYELAASLRVSKRLMRIDPKGVSECFYGDSTPLGDRLSSSENHN